MSTVGIEAGDAGNSLDLLEVFDEVFQMGGIVDEDHDGTLENALVAGNGNGSDVHFEVVRYHLRDFIDEPYIIDAYDTQAGQERQFLLRRPFGLYDTVSVVGHQLGRIGAVGTMDLDAVGNGDETEYVIAWYGVTKVRARSWMCFARIMT